MSTKTLAIVSNFLNERPQAEAWVENMKQIADAGILVVDGGSTDGTIEYLESQGVVVVIDDIIRREGYGPARNHLREMARKYFPDAHWAMFLDADERIDPIDFHQLRFLKDYLIDDFDVVAFPRIDWMDDSKTKAAKDWHVEPDYQARMTRLGCPIEYIRRLHEQITGYKGIHASLVNPKINHFHRTAGQEKRDEIGMVCAMLHNKDSEFGHTYPKHKKEDMYLQMAREKGLIE